MNNTETIKKTKQAISEVLNKQGYVSMVDVLQHMGKLTKTDYENWRYKRIPYLEKAISTNLGKISLILKTYAKTCTNDYGLKPSTTGYNKWGKGGKLKLVFSKTMNPHVEKQYATHYVFKALVQKKKETHEPPPSMVPAL